MGGVGIHPPGFKSCHTEKIIYASAYVFHRLFLTYYNTLGNAKNWVKNSNGGPMGHF